MIKHQSLVEEQSFFQQSLQLLLVFFLVVFFLALAMMILRFMVLK